MEQRSILLFYLDRVPSSYRVWSSKRFQEKPSSNVSNSDFMIRESNIGKPGVWVYLIGDKRRYGRFRILAAGNDDGSDDVFAPVQRK